MASPQKMAERMYATLQADLETRLLRIKDYLEGRHDDPYMPDQADREYELLAERAKSGNYIPIAVESVVQVTYVDGYRPGSDRNLDGSGIARGKVAPNRGSEAWRAWQRSRLDARQTAITREAVAYGHSFVVVEDTAFGPLAKGLSPLRTVAFYADPANDDAPTHALHVTRWEGRDTEGEIIEGLGWVTDDTYRYSFVIREGKIHLSAGRKHGCRENPVTRFAAAVDLEGNTFGVVEPLIGPQNRLNQTTLDLLLVQTYSSVKVRFASGMTPTFKTDEDGEVILDKDTGQPIPLPINYNAQRFLFSESEDVKFGTLDETPLGGFIQALEDARKNFAVLSTTPPHYMLGDIANLSAEALEAATMALMRKADSFKICFGESWERVFRLFGQLLGDEELADDYSGEVVWRDVDGHSLAQAADALGKLREQLGIPARGLWHRVPDVTQNEIEVWEALAEAEDTDAQFMDSLRRATGPTVEVTTGREEQYVEDATA